jgi:hypothetical protein
MYSEIPSKRELPMRTIERSKHHIFHARTDDMFELLSVGVGLCNFGATFESEPSKAICTEANMATSRLKFVEVY